MESTKTYQQLVEENAELHLKLEEATDIIDAIRKGNIDGLVVQTDEGTQLYTLRNADQNFRIFIEQMNEGAVTLNRDGLVLYSNFRFADMIGLPIEKVIGQHFISLVITEQKDFWKDLFMSSWEDDVKDELVLSGNGMEVPVILSLKILKQEEGFSMSVLITDLSGQKETQRILTKKNQELERAQNTALHLNATLENTVQERTLELKRRTEELEQNIRQKINVEKQLRSNEERLQQILETMAEGVGIFDANGTMTYANPMARKILGLRFGVLYDYKQWNHLKVDGSFLPNEEHPIAVALDAGKLIFDYELSLKNEVDGTIYISINAAPLRNDNNDIVGCIVTFMDVTHRRLDLFQKDEFISVASHELKTPITSLKASLQLMHIMKDEPHSAVYGQMLDQALKSLNKVSALVEDLLNTTKLKEGQLSLKKQHFLLSEVAADCCQQIIATARQPILIQGDVQLGVLADTNKIEQVIVNLVNNAVKYAADSKEIIIRIEQEGQMAKVSVIDQGPGIPSGKIPHLFDRYYRVDFNGLQYSGLGLGLYISAQIIKKHDGQIGVDSEIGLGSRFWFTLPL